MNDKKFKGININNDLSIDVFLTLGSKFFPQYILTNHMKYSKKGEIVKFNYIPLYYSRHSENILVTARHDIKMNLVDQIINLKLTYHMP